MFCLIDIHSWGRGVVAIVPEDISKCSNCCVIKGLIIIRRRLFFFSSKKKIFLLIKFRIKVQ